jgi:hypothetical protein
MILLGGAAAWPLAAPFHHGLACFWSPNKPHSWRDPRKKTN